MLDIPVLISGGGPVGLTASLLLSQHGVRSLLVERHPGTALTPKARVAYQLSPSTSLGAPRHEVRSATSRTASAISWDSVVPDTSTASGLTPFAAARPSVERPWAPAMPESVSPGCTT